VAWHATTVAEVEQRWATSARGLGGAEAARRLAHHGPNRLAEEPPTPALVVFARQFADPLIAILLVAAVVTVVMRELLDASLIAVALLLNAVIGFTQERRAADAVRALMRLVVQHSRVVRDGREQVVDSAELVPGDLVVLEPGSRVPADLRLCSVNELQVDESLLTGESIPVEKDTAPVAERTSIGDRTSMAYTGSVVTSGRGRGYVVATGQATELGSIAGLVRGQEVSEGPLAARMASFARVIGVSVLAASVITFVSGVALGSTAEEMFRTAVAMAVSAVPEGLPVAVTVTLAIGVGRMARRNAVLRRLPSIEALGSTTVIGSDKTGTLTENRMTVQAVWADGRILEVTDGLDGHSAASDAVRHTLRAGALTNEAQVVHEPDGPVHTGDPTVPGTPPRWRCCSRRTWRASTWTSSARGTPWSPTSRSSPNADGPAPCARWTASRCSSSRARPSGSSACARRCTPTKGSGRWTPTSRTTRPGSSRLAACGCSRWPTAPSTRVLRSTRSRTGWCWRGCRG